MWFIELNDPLLPKSPVNFINLQFSSYCSSSLSTKKLHVSISMHLLHVRHTHILTKLSFWMYYISNPLDSQSWRILLVSNLTDPATLKINVLPLLLLYTLKIKKSFSFHSYFKKTSLLAGLSQTIKTITKGQWAIVIKWQPIAVPIPLWVHNRV